MCWVARRPGRTSRKQTVSLTLVGDSSSCVFVYVAAISVACTHSHPQTLLTAVCLLSLPIHSLLSPVAVTCPSCSAGQAYFMQVQIRSADEPATIFYRCVECTHTWREG